MVTVIIRDMELDVVGLLETDLHVSQPFMMFVMFTNNGSP